MKGIVMDRKKRYSQIQKRMAVIVSIKKDLEFMSAVIDSKLNRCKKAFDKCVVEVNLVRKSMR